MGGDFTPTLWRCFLKQAGQPADPEWNELEPHTILNSKGTGRNIRRAWFRMWRGEEVA